jgi:hypothetical protein
MVAKKFFFYIKVFCCVDAYNLIFKKKNVLCSIRRSKSCIIYFNHKNQMIWVKIWQLERSIAGCLDSIYVYRKVLIFEFWWNILFIQNWSLFQDKSKFTNSIFHYELWWNYNASYFRHENTFFFTRALRQTDIMNMFH